MTAHSRTTVKLIERAISGARTAGIEICRVMVDAGGVVEIVTADGLKPASLDAEAVTCDDVFGTNAQRS